MKKKKIALATFRCECGKEYHIYADGPTDIVVEKEELEWD